MWNINVKIGIIRGLKKLWQNYLPNVLRKTNWNTANMPLTYMTEITLVLFSHQSHGWFSISQTSYDTDFHKIQQSFQGSHFCFCHFYKEGSEKQETENKNRWVSSVLFFWTWEKMFVSQSAQKLQDCCQAWLLAECRDVLSVLLVFFMAACCLLGQLSCFNLGH